MIFKYNSKWMPFSCFAASHIIYYVLEPWKSINLGAWLNLSASSNRIILELGQWLATACLLIVISSPNVLKIKRPAPHELIINALSRWREERNLQSSGRPPAVATNFLPGKSGNGVALFAVRKLKWATASHPMPPAKRIVRIEMSFFADAREISQSISVTFC